jgi:hypothetical protein
MIPKINTINTSIILNSFPELNSLSDCFEHGCEDIVLSEIKKQLRKVGDSFLGQLKTPDLTKQIEDAIQHLLAQYGFTAKDLEIFLDE